MGRKLGFYFLHYFFLPLSWVRRKVRDLTLPSVSPEQLLKKCYREKDGGKVKVSCYIAGLDEGQ